MIIGIILDMKNVRLDEIVKGILFVIVFSDEKYVRIDFWQQELCLTLFLMKGKMFNLIFGNRNYVQPCF